MGRGAQQGLAAERGKHGIPWGWLGGTRLSGTPRAGVRKGIGTPGCPVEEPKCLVAAGPVLEDWDIISPREVAAVEPLPERRSLLAAALPFTQALLAQVSGIWVSGGGVPGFPHPAETLWSSLGRPKSFPATPSHLPVTPSHLPVLPFPSQCSHSPPSAPSFLSPPLVTRFLAGGPDAGPGAGSPGLA